VIGERVAAVRQRIALAAARAGRRAEDVRLVAVSKTFAAEAVREAFAAGLRDFAENKVQEAEEKIPALEDLRVQGLVWHLVGHLQTNKANKAAGLFQWIHSVDTSAIGLKLERYAALRRMTLPVLVQVDLSGERTKHGLPEDHVFPALETLRGLKSVHVKGLMLLPPLHADPEQVRPYFRRLRELRDRAADANLLLGGELSMGMSHDFDVAIEEGATMVRIGSAIFGQRPAR
jgi:pyridoxal phosphate enzyme (YggS family)